MIQVAPHECLRLNISTQLSYNNHSLLTRSQWTQNRNHYINEWSERVKDEKAVLKRFSFISHISPLMPFFLHAEKKQSH